MGAAGGAVDPAAGPFLLRLNGRAWHLAHVSFRF